MKIGMFTDSYFPQVSGVSTSIRILKEELEALGHEVIIFTTTDPRVEEEEENVVRLPSIPFFSFKDRRIAIKGMGKALKEAKKRDIDIVHTHTEFSLGLTGRFIAYRLEIPSVHTYHTMYEKYLHYIAKGRVVKPEAVKIISRVYCNRTMGVIAPSQTMRNKLSSYNISSEISVIPTGVPIPERIPGIKEEMRRKLGLQDSELVLLSLSRLAFEKSLDQLLYALPEVLEQYPTTKLVMVGDGPAKAELEELTSRLSLEEHVLFVGEVKNEEVNPYYQMADLYINASESETQGLTYLEAIVNGCPVIARKNDYLKEIIRRPSFGSLFDETVPLSEAIIQFVHKKSSLHDIETEEEWEELLREISSRTFVKRVLNFYKKIINQYYFATKKEVHLTYRLLGKLKRIGQSQ